LLLLLLRFRLRSLLHALLRFGRTLLCALRGLLRLSRLLGRLLLRLVRLLSRLLRLLLDLVQLLPLFVNSSSALAASRCRLLASSYAFCAC
jgi:hypothetical protein